MKQIHNIFNFFNFEKCSKALFVILRFAKPNLVTLWLKRSLSLTAPADIDVYWVRQNISRYFKREIDKPGSSIWFPSLVGVPVSPKSVICEVTYN